jgi:putative Mg2+ transporter-C (MgtC) family protein
MEPITHAHFLLDAVIALGLGALIGVERQYRQHPAGLRTNALVCLGAALFVGVTRLLGGADRFDATRVASYVVSGVGFLGGGVILRDGMTVKGIDTAATLWCAAAVGVLAGMGFPYAAGIGAGLILGLNLSLRPVARWVDARRLAADGEVGYRIQVICQGKARSAVQGEMRRLVDALPGVLVQGVVARQSKRRKRATVTVDLLAEKRDDRAMEVVVTQLGQMPGVLAAEWGLNAPQAG